LFIVTDTKVHGSVISNARLLSPFPFDFCLNLRWLYYMICSVRNTA